MAEACSSSKIFVAESNAGATLYQDKEVVNCFDPEAVREEKIALPQPSEIHAYYADPPQQITQSRPSFIKRRRTLVSALLFGVIIIALAIAIPVAILHNISSKSTQSPSSTSDATRTAVQSTSAVLTVSTPKPSSIAALSPLAAVSWPDTSSGSGGYNTKLVFQNEDGLFRTSTYSSVSDKWRMESLDLINAKKGSPIALTRFLTLNGAESTAVQIELFYVNENNLLREWNWGPLAGGPKGGSGSLNERDYSCSSNSSLSAYWPFLFYQGSENKLYQIQYNGQGFFSRSLNVSISKQGPSIVGVPATMQQATTSIISLNEGGNLMEYVVGDGFSGTLKKDPIVSSLAPTARFGVFAMPPTPPNADPNSLSTYILYQSPTNNTIYMIWRSAAPTSPTSGSTWFSPVTSPAFDGADKGTDIACVTGFSQPNRDIQTGEGLGRCYFQVSGNVREVELLRAGNGTLDWRVVGLVKLE